MESHIMTDQIQVGGFTIVKNSDGTCSLFKGLTLFASGPIRTDIARKICAELPYHSLSELSKKYGLSQQFFVRDPYSL